MTITNTITNLTTQHYTIKHQKITNQHQNNNHNDPHEDQHDTTQPRQEQQFTPVHQEPMVCAARPDGPAAEIHSLRVVDLARAVASPC